MLLLLLSVEDEKEHGDGIMGEETLLLVLVVMGGGFCCWRCRRKGKTQELGSSFRMTQFRHGGPRSSHLTCRLLQFWQPLRDLLCDFLAILVVILFSDKSGAGDVKRSHLVAGECDD